jgi:hypothetical protein
VIQSTTSRITARSTIPRPSRVASTEVVCEFGVDVRGVVR